MRLCIAAAVLWRIAYAGYLTSAQYALWASHPFTKLFLTMPADGAPDAFISRFINAASGGQGYFWYYSFGRFWLPALLAVGFAFFMYFILVIVRHIRPSALTGEDSRILLLAALLLPWPLGLAFYAFAFVAGILFAAAVALTRQKWKATMAPPAAFAFSLTLIFKDVLLRFILPLL